jgi:hypothetical protein
MNPKLKLKLVAESGVTIAQGEVPVLLSTATYMSYDVVAQTVNFLRSGCTQVQWLVDQDGLDHHDNFADYTAKLRAALDNLQLPGEKFDFTPTTGCLDRGDVLLITRQKTS